MAVLLYIAKPKNEEIIIQEDEIENAKWCNFEDALETLTFDNFKKMFRKVIDDIS